jgi:ribulose-bisphosphate carboxylase large chain
MSDDRILITYLLTPSPGERAEDRARAIALEQTVELPEGCYPQRIRDSIVGRVENVERAGGARWRVTISYPSSLAGTEAPQLLNLLFGNISMQQGIVVEDVDLPERVLAGYAGPRFGIDGVRVACGDVRGRPLLCSAAKPVGLTPEELAERCGALARGGADIVKDDHGVMNQEPAPFRERVARCQEAVLRANAGTGGHTLYFPNVAAPRSQLEERVAVAREAGCEGVLVSPFLMGLDVLPALAASSGLILLAHPTFSGALSQPGHGLTPSFLFGRLLRILGADAVIYVNAGGRFPVSVEECSRINQRLREPWSRIRPALPVAGGGVDAASVPSWIERYGSDIMFLVGSSLYATDDLEGATRALATTLERQASV